MKCVLLSIKPRFVADILNGKKTIEIRKRFPLNYRGWVYIYCTKGKYEMGRFRSDNLYHEIRDDCCYAGGWSRGLPDEIVNGKVVARFYCDNVEEIEKIVCYCRPYDLFRTKSLDYAEFEKASCLSKEELTEYFMFSNLPRESACIHISKLEIFDKPKELGEFYRFKNIYCNECKYYAKDCKGSKKGMCEHSKIHLTRRPQSWQFIEVGD